jgi:hypothetical protein
MSELVASSSLAFVYYGSWASLYFQTPLRKLIRRAQRPKNTLEIVKLRSAISFAARTAQKICLKSKSPGDHFMS